MFNQALDTLGNTKWRINKKVLSLVDRIWANGGRLGGLVDREDVRSLLFTHPLAIFFRRMKNFDSYISFINFDFFSRIYKLQKVPVPEEPEREDHEKFKNWKWESKKAIKQNNERHSQRCDIELKLEVREDFFLHSFLLL